MAINWTEAQINEIIGAVLKEIGTEKAPASTWNSTSYCGRKLIGIYADMNDAIAAANEGYKKKCRGAYGLAFSHRSTSKLRTSEVRGCRGRRAH